MATDFSRVIGDWDLKLHEIRMLKEHADLVKQIHENLQFLPPKQAHAWPRTPNDNPMFGGRPPLVLMLIGREGLERVLRFILSENGGPL